MFLLTLKTVSEPVSFRLTSANFFFQHLSQYSLHPKTQDLSCNIVINFGHTFKTGRGSLRLNYDVMRRLHNVVIVIQSLYPTDVPRLQTYREPSANFHIRWTRIWKIQALLCVAVQNRECVIPA